MLEYLKPEAVKNFFKVRGEDGKFSPEQVKATLIQTGLILVFISVLVGLFLILWNAGVVQWIAGQ